MSLEKGPSKLDSGGVGIHKISPFTPPSAKVLSPPSSSDNTSPMLENTKGTPWYKQRLFMIGSALLAVAIVGGLYMKKRQHAKLKNTKTPKGMTSLSQTAPTRLLRRVNSKSKAFAYCMITVYDKDRRRVYEGNVLTFYGRPNDYIGVTPSGFEVWNVNTIYNAQNKASTPLLFTRSFENVQDDLWIPYFLTCPVRRILKTLKIYTWEEQRVTLGLQYYQGKFSFIIDGKPIGNTLHYLDGKGRQRIATLEGTV